jgi:hypothetical protein
MDSFSSGERRIWCRQQHGPAFPFATAIVREESVVRIHCRFADKADADVLARLTNARRAAVLSGWSSHGH